MSIHWIEHREGSIKTVIGGGNKVPNAEQCKRPSVYCWILSDTPMSATRLTRAGSQLSLPEGWVGQLNQPLKDLILATALGHEIAVRIARGPSPMQTVVREGDKEIVSRERL